jgi:hypothetical protein
MAATKTKQRIQVGSAPWVAEERSSANTIVETESEEFGFSVRNDLDWLNEHMAEIFSENQMYVDTECLADGILMNLAQKRRRDL